MATEMKIENQKMKTEHRTPNFILPPQNLPLFSLSSFKPHNRYNR